MSDEELPPTSDVDHGGCEDCVSKELIRARLTDLWHHYGARLSMKMAVVDVAKQLGVELDLARKSANG